MRKLSATLAVAATLLAAAACSDDDTGHDERSSVPESADFNDADVEFATHMVQHHAQALAMVDLTRDRDLSRPVAALAEQILMAQGPEIEQMTDWLVACDQPVPETVRDHANAHGDGHVETDDMPGMPSEEQMAELEDTDDQAFEDLWLELMIEHHQGAVEMAQAEQVDGEHADAVALAESIESTQEAEIDQMEELLGS